MGCGLSTDDFIGAVSSEAVIDLALVPQMTDADAKSLRPTVEENQPSVLRMPRWSRPNAPITCEGLAHLCVAATGSLRTVEVNEAAVPNATAEGIARALGLLGSVTEVSLRGPMLPRRVLAVLGDSGAMPLTTVKSVLLGGGGVDAVALAALPRAFPCVERLYLQHTTGVLDWRSTATDLHKRGVSFTHVTHVVFDSPMQVLTAPVEAALMYLWPQLGPQGIVKLNTFGGASDSFRTVPSGAAGQQQATAATTTSTARLPLPQRSPRTLDVIAPPPPLLRLTQVASSVSDRGTGLIDFSSGSRKLPTELLDSPSETRNASTPARPFADATKMAPTGPRRASSLPSAFNPAVMEFSPADQPRPATHANPLDPLMSFQSSTSGRSGSRSDRHASDPRVIAVAPAVTTTAVPILTSASEIRPVELGNKTHDASTPHLSPPSPGADGTLSPNSTRKGALLGSCGGSLPPAPVLSSLK